MGFNKAIGDEISAAQFNAFIAASGLYAAANSGTDDYTITVNPVPNDYDAGDKYIFKADVVNTGSATLNVNGLGAKTIKKLGGSSNLVTGDILVGQLVIVQYDGTNFQMISAPNLASSVPVVRKYEPTVTNYGSSTTRFDITNPAGSTFRYTYDATGTDPTINTTNFPTGAIVQIASENFNENNNGTFVITGSGANYFEVTNALGVVGVDQTLSSAPTGVLRVVKTQTWTKPAGLKYVLVEVVGGGGGGSGKTPSGAGGGGGGYSRKLIAEATLGATETLMAAPGGVGGQESSSGNFFGGTGGTSYFGSHLTGAGGGGGVDTGAGAGGVGSSGDINIPGQAGGGENNDAGTDSYGGHGGSSRLGLGAWATTDTESQGVQGGNYGGGGSGESTAAGSTGAGGDGGFGVVLVTEHYV